MKDRHLAELNVGRLLADTGDPRVAEFMAELDRINGLGKRMPGFVWMMEGSGEPGTGNTAAKIGGDPRHVSNLTVWEDARTLETFVWNTVHRQFYERRADWFEVLGQMHFVMWWVPQGHRPTLDEALGRLEHRREHGDTGHAFGWEWLKDATLWRDRHCAPVAAEQWMEITGKIDVLRVHDTSVGRASFQDLHLANAQFNNANLSGLRMQDCNLSSLGLLDVNLSMAHIKNTNLTGVIIEDCEVEGMTINGVQVTDLFAAYENRKN